ncbi:MAG: phosphoenolpyruvate carboxykinase [Lachnospiraceae bacterium]|nr:phosphoenolpyruvate carboxykinase [Lachnospiraceae bacterium]
MKSIVNTDYGTCYLCGSHRNLEEHHIFGGPNRKISEKYGLKVRLCRDCHTGNEGVHKKKELMNSLKMMGQTVFESKYENREIKVKKTDYEEFYDRSPREKFMQLIGRNYI